VPISWTTRIEAWQPPYGFVDRQLRGPYRLWEHTHELEAVAGGTLIRDRVRYRTPAGRRLVARWLRAIFDFRAQATRQLLTGENPTSRD
jgi:ligand-binding SRPBCC domain-containing protein